MDFDSYWALVGNAELAQAAGFWVPEDKYAGQLLFSAALQRDLTYMIVIENDIIGSISFEQISGQNNALELGYLLLPSYAGKGIMTEAVRLAIVEAFTKLGCKQLIAKIKSTNVASKVVVEKNNFKRMAINDDIETFTLNKNDLI